MSRRKTPASERTSRQSTARSNPSRNDEHNDLEEEEEEDAPEEVKDSTEALRGQVDADYPLTSNIVRIFTSSTFTDTKVERNALMERVYPVLKEYCQQRGYDFQVVDMRWGVRDEATDDHMTSELCMKEIRDCQKYSTGPNFITFLGQKYGYRPFPPRILAEEFDELLGAVTDSADRQLLTDWFLLDENAVPAHYQLQPIRDKLPNYADDSDPDKKKEARSDWWAAFERMQVVLREASSAALDDPDKVHKYHWSVTEEEIKHGILESKSPTTQCYWFRRHFPDLLEHTSDKIAKRFMDIAGGGDVDQPAFDFLTKLKEELIPEKLPTENITEYSVGWTPNGVDPPNSEEHAEYLENFLRDFERELKRMIDEGIEARKQEAVTDPLSLECIEHATFAKTKAAVFQGRVKVMQDIKEKLVGPDKLDGPLVLLGEPGSGKTTLMAKLTELLPKWLQEDAEANKKMDKKDDEDKIEELEDYEDDFEDDGTKLPPVLVRFIGTTSKSSTTRELLASINQQIITVTERGEEVATDLKELKSQFHELVSETEQPLVVILDSLDQLRDHGAGLKDWLPKTLPPNVTVLMSAIPAEEFIVGPELTRHLEEKCFLNVPLMDETEIGDVIRYSLDHGRRTLQQPQLQILERACQQCALPLYVKVAVDEARRWRSHTLVSPAHLGAVINDLVEDLLERTEKYHGKVLVSHALGYVTAAKAGLSTPEIEDVLSCDDVVLKDVLQYHVPPQRRLPPLLWLRIQSDLSEYLVEGGADGGVQVYRWYHRQFTTVAQQRYLADEEQKAFLHESLAAYFAGKWSGGEKKPYVDHKNGGKAAEADRFVAKQPYVFSDHDVKKSVFNLRKISELPYQLIKAGNLELLKEKALCNFEFLYEKLRAVGFDVLYDDFEQAKKEGMYDSDLKAVARTLLQSKDGLMRGPYNLSVQIVGRLGEKETDPKKEKDTEGKKEKDDEKETKDDKKKEDEKNKGDGNDRDEDKDEEGKEKEEEEEEKDSIGRLVEQAMDPHFSCLVTKQPFMKASGSALISKLVGHEQMITALTLNADATVIATADMYGTFYLWDLDSTSLNQSFSFNQEDEGRILPSKLMFIDDDQTLLAAASEFVYAIDIAGERVKEKARICEEGTVENPMAAAYFHYENNVLVVMCNAPEIRALEFPGGGGKVVAQIGDLEKIDMTNSLGASYLGGAGEDIVFHRGGSNKVHFFSLKKYKKTLKSIEMHKEPKSKKVLARVVSTPSGLVGCFVYRPPPERTAADTNYNPNFKDFPAEVQVYDIRTKALVRTISNILGGYVLGLEQLVYMADDRVLMNSYQAQFTQFQEMNLEAGTWTVALATREGNTAKMVACADRLVGVPMSEPKVLVQYDLTLGGEAENIEDKDGDGIPDWYDEGYQVKGFIPGSERFVLYATLAGNLNVWDLATNRTVRGLKGVGLGGEAAWLDDQRVVLPLNRGLLTVDMYDLNIINNLPGVFADSNDQPLRFGLTEKDIAVLIGPNDNQISLINLNNGRIDSKFVIEDDVKLGGVLVNEDRSIALASEKQFLENSNNQPPKDGIAKIYVLDLKARCRLPDIVLREQEHKLHVTAHTYNNAAFTADGERYASVVNGKRQAELWVWQTRTGQGEIVPQAEEHHSVHLVSVSNVLRCFVFAYTDNQLRLWNYDNQEYTKTINLTRQGAQVGPVRMSVSGDGVNVAIAFGNNEAALIGLESGQILYQVYSPTTILGIGAPGCGDYFLLAATSILGVAQFFWARPHQGRRMLEDREKLAEDKEDVMGEPRFVKKTRK